jgi:ribosomal protein S18 acetylase RimI-like enzyme
MGVSYLAKTSNTEIIELRHISARDLQPVLDEETQTWMDRLEWDFRPSAELVLEFVDLHTLGGFALLVDGDVKGYTYFIEEEQKGLIGDIYVTHSHRNEDLENRLLWAVVNELVSVCAVRRIESQLMMLDAPVDRQMVFPRQVEMFRRTFMVREAGAVRLPQTDAADAILFESWREERHEDASQLICEAYVGHIDSRINNQYRSLAGARQFLTNIIKYPGCGRFFQPASFFVFRKDTGLPCGLVLASMVSDHVGHITQVCVTRDSRGMGIGYEMMRRAINELEQAGCKRISLTVTTANAAIALYEQMGFQRAREFGAHVWDGF